MDYTCKTLTQGIPMRWCSRRREEIIEQLCKELRDSHYRLGKGRAHHNQGRGGYTHMQTPKRAALEVRELSLLVNVPAYLYIVQPPVQTHYTTDPIRWVACAWDEWKRYAVDTHDIIADIKGPFGMMTVERSLGLSVRRRLGIDKTEDLPESDGEQQQYDLAMLLHHHQQLCNLVDTQVRTLTPESAPEPECLMSWDGTQLTNPVLSPVCRAVMLLAESCLYKELRVYLILTGDSSDMVSGPPTFDSIPKSGIFARWGETDNII